MKKYMKTDSSTGILNDECKATFVGPNGEARGLKNQWENINVCNFVERIWK